VQRARLRRSAAWLQPGVVHERVRGNAVLHGRGWVRLHADGHYDVFVTA